MREGQASNTKILTTDYGYDTDADRVTAPFGILIRVIRVIRGLEIFVGMWMAQKTP